MKEFQDLGAFASHLAMRAGRAVATFHAASEAVGQLVEKAAKDEMGTYQAAAGPFPAWAELAESTKEDRERQGYTPNDPLLRSGELRDSVSHEASTLEVVIGTPREEMIYLEFGTSKMPARPVFGPAVFNNREKIGAIIGFAAVTAVFNPGSGIMPVHAALGYNMRVGFNP